MKCENCDRPLATKQDAKDIPPGEGEHLCWGACEPEDWRARALKAERERDEARAEVERLTEERDRVARELRRIDEHGSLRAAIRAAAERQREACATVVRELLDDEECDCPPEWPRCGLHRAALRLRATPLVTEGDK